MTAVIVRARTLEERGGGEQDVAVLADTFCRQSRRRISDRFRSLFRNDDDATYDLARRFLDGRLEWLEEGVVSLERYRRKAERPSPSEATPADTASAREPATTN